MADKVGSVYYELLLNKSQFDSQMKEAQAGFRKSLNNMQSVGRKMSTFITLPVLGAGLAAIKAASSYEQLEVAMTTMLGSAQKAKQLLRELDALAVKTPFTITEVQESAKQLIAYGIASEDVVETTKTLGDIASGLGKDSFPRLIYAFGQIKASGKLYGTELRQLTETGFNLAEAMGMTRGELLELMDTEKGVTFNEVQKAFKKSTEEGGRFHDMMQKQSKTTAGQASNTADEIIRLGREIGTSLLPAVKDVLVYVRDLVKWFAGLSENNKKIILGFVAFVAVAGPALIALANFIKAYQTVKGAIIATKAAQVLFGNTLIGGQGIGAIGRMKGSLSALRGLMVAFPWMAFAGAGIAAIVLTKIAMDKLKDKWNAVMDKFLAASGRAVSGLEAMNRKFREGKISAEEYGIAAKNAALLANNASTEAYNTRKSLEGFSGFLNFLGGARAEGGPVNANVPYLVGEKGPELYVPNKSGQIIPNNQLNNMSIYGNVNIGNKQTADYFFSRNNRQGDLLGMGLSPIGGA